MAVQVYGPNQTAGLPVVTTGKSAPTSDGTVSYAQVVAVVGGDGTTVGGSTANPVVIQSQSRQLTPKGYQQILAAATAAAVGLTIPSGATSAIIQAEAQDARWRDDGVNPTAAIGMILKVASELVVNDEALANLKFINLTAGTILNVSYYA